MINKILIIEDEKPNADRLIRLIKNIKPKAVILDVLDSVIDSIGWFENNVSPDIVLMDVRLSDGLSFDIFNQVDIACPIIFTTAYDEYAVRAFKFNSVDYLLKPVEQDELQNAFYKIETITEEYKKKSLEGVIDYYQPKQYRSRFLLPDKGGYKSVLVNNIVFFYSELKITRIKLKDNSWNIVPQTLEELEIQLDPKLFFRANRQYIIYIESIKQILNSSYGKLRIIIRSNPETEIIISRDKASIFKEWMNY